MQRLSLGGKQMAELKRCPFCGGKADLVLKGGSYMVKCRSCPAAVITQYVHQTEEEAIEAWNRRAEDEK